MLYAITSLKSRTQKVLNFIKIIMTENLTLPKTCPDFTKETD